MRSRQHTAEISCAKISYDTTRYRLNSFIVHARANLQDFPYSYELVRFVRCLSVCVSVTIVGTCRILAKIKNIKTRVYFDICHRMVSLRKLYSVTLTYIFDFKSLKYVRFVRFRMLPESWKYEKQSAIHTQTFLIERRKYHIFCNFDLKVKRLEYEFHANGKC